MKAFGYLLDGNGDIYWDSMSASNGLSGFEWFGIDGSGNFWYQQNGSGTPYENGTPQVTLGTYNAGGVLGEDGAMWFGGTCSAVKCFVRYAGSNPQLFQVSGLHGAPTFLMQGPDGNIWFVEAGSNYYGKITP